MIRLLAEGERKASVVWQSVSMIHALHALNPCGTPPAIIASQAATRLPTLRGAAITLIDVSFDDGDRFLDQLAAALTERYPDITIRRRQYVRGYLHPDPELDATIAADSQAVVIAIGHCSGCAPAVTLRAIGFEVEYRRPTFAIHCAPFAAVTRAVARGKGLEGLPMGYVPMPVMGRSNDELRALVRGHDPVSGRPLLDALEEALTLDPICGQTVQMNRGPNQVGAADDDAMQELFRSTGWTDHLPIIIPTRARVDDMLRGTSRPRELVVGSLSPNGNRRPWTFSVEQVAVNAVMAGCRSAHLPVLLALAASGCTARPSTTTGAAQMTLVNGPIRHEIGMNAGIGAMGPYNHANAAIGRAYGLLSQNLQGGSVPGETYLGSQGNSLAYNSLCFAENEEDSPWEPFHVARGFAATASTVSVFHGNRDCGFMLGLRERHWREHVRQRLCGLDPGKGAPCLVLDPLAARQFVERGGFTTRAALKDWIYDQARMPADVFWDLQTVQNYKLPAAHRGESPYAEALSAPPEAPIRIYPREAINIIVVGGGTNAYWRMFGNEYQTTVPIDPWR